MTVEEAVQVRERAISLGLEDCCDECRAAIQRLKQLGRVDAHSTQIPKSASPTYFPQSAVAKTVGAGAEKAVLHLRRKIAAPPR